MQKAKKNMSKINFKRAVTQKFKEYDQKLDALTSIYVSEAIDKPRLNNSVLEVMQNNQIRIFTKPSIFIDDLSDMDLKLKLLNRIHKNKSRPTNKKHYDTLYDFILLDQEAEPSFHKRAHDYQDPPTDREGEKRKKRRKVAGQSSKFSRKDKDPMVHAQEYTSTYQPQDQEDLYVQERPNAGWFTKKSRSANAMRRTT
ncbi:hypothetical protein Tco_0088525 [Tanacetum coccineum]